MPNAGKFLSKICCDRMRAVTTWAIYYDPDQDRQRCGRNSSFALNGHDALITYKTLKRVLRLINIETFSVRSTFVLALNLNLEDEKRNESSTKRALNGEDDSRQKKLKVKT